MIYPAFRPVDIQLDWKELDGVKGTIQIVEGLAVLRTEDFRLIVLDQSPDLGKLGV